MIDKRIKLDNMNENYTNKLPSSVLVKFAKFDSTAVGSTMDVPITSSLSQLEILLNSLLNNTEKVKKSFYNCVNSLVRNTFSIFS
jgi:hypothetical protein